MDVLSIKSAKADKYLIELEEWGEPIAWINDQVKDMSKPEFYQWLAELLILKLNKEQFKDIKRRAIEAPKSIPSDFIFVLEHVVAYELYHMFKEEIEKHVDVESLKKQARLKQGWKS